MLRAKRLILFNITITCSTLIYGCTVYNVNMCDSSNND